MRNWNNLAWRIWPENNTRFYFTYEELKLSWVEGVIDMLPCFYFTYEELKQTTRRLTRFMFVFVFTLPMRNWNSAIVLTATIARHVFTLPMRNWNLYQQPTSPRVPPCFYFTYEELKLLLILKSLIGIWKVFTLPMRNWNSLVFVSTKTLSWEFLLYLWGIETSGRFTWMWVKITCFYFTYEELKHSCLY